MKRIASTPLFRCFTEGGYIRVANKLGIGNTGSKEGFSSEGRAAEKFKFPLRADEKVH
jgi:hypothetical protein